MTTNPTLQLFKRKTLDQILKVPKGIISVYIVEQHIWESDDLARKNRIAKTQTVEEFLIDPVRPFLVDIFRLLSAEYDPARRDNPIGQGYWIQAEFGSGKSHLLSFIGALALGGEKEWGIVKQKEEKAGRGRRDSLYHFYENGLAEKTKNTRGILVAVKTLVGQGGNNPGGIGAEKTLADYVLDAVGEAFYAETGRTLPFYPEEMLAERFIQHDLNRYQADLARYLKTPGLYHDGREVPLGDFIEDLQNTRDPKVRQDSGRILWNFYREFLKVTPDIPTDSEVKLDHMMQLILDEGYAGLLLILDEVSLYMKGRSDTQKAEDEMVLVVLSNRLAKLNNRPIWTICSAQQAIESEGGVRNIIADDRLKLEPLLNNEQSYYDIALSRVREITDPAAIDQYYEDYKRSFSWPQNAGKDKFVKFFPFYPPAIDVVRAVSYRLTTMRSALSFMLETVKAMRLAKSDELITHWNLFDDVVNYSEDPSGTHRAIVAIRTKFTDAWQAYEEVCRQIDASPDPMVRAYRNRCIKVVKTLFLYHVANRAPNGLSSEELMNSVMEWKDQDKDRQADLQDNKDHYENLVEKLDIELSQVKKNGRNYQFVIEAAPPVQELFARAKAEAENSRNKRREAWRQLLALDGWPVQSNFMTTDLARGIRSLFRAIAPENTTDVTISWHNREITGRVFMRDLMDIVTNNRIIPSVNSAETGLDFSVFISNTPTELEPARLTALQKDPRVMYWLPDKLTPGEEALLIDFAAYRSLVADYSNRDTADAQAVMEWVKGRLGAEMGAIYRIVTESYSRGRILALNHASLPFNVSGELSAILNPLAAQVLDAVYETAGMTFHFNSPFNDVNAINVMNGIVRMGEFPRGVKPSKEVSASQNFGFDLRIMVHPNDKKLDLRQCTYAADLLEWIREKTGQGTTTISAETLYKNFTGINGPNHKHYGLSKRMVQLYLLCLAREGRLRISLSGRNQPAEAVDYTNIAGIDIKVAVLDGFDEVQLLKPPEGWDVLAPFAAILLEDETLKTIREDAQIQSAVLKLGEWKAQQQAAFSRIQADIAATCSEFKLENPLAEKMSDWERFLKVPIEPTDPIACWRSALARGFHYPLEQLDEVDSEDLDDLAARAGEIRQVERFHAHDSEFRTAMRYLQAQLPEEEALRSAARTFDACRARLDQLGNWMTGEPKLESEFLSPMRIAIESYQVRYLQAFDRVVAHTETIRSEILTLAESKAYRALALLGEITALGEDAAPGLKQRFEQAAGGPALFPAELTRAVVERDLATTPEPARCPLRLPAAADWIASADAALADCRTELEKALQDKARLLLSPALRERLSQGRGEAFIASVLNCAAPQELADYLAAQLDREHVHTLERCLKKLTVVKVRLRDFHPSRRTLEKVDIAAAAREFEDFLRNSFPDGGGDDQVTILEIE